jgi:signal transduction histidine kinase
LRLAARKATAQQQQLLDMAMHDLRNPLTTIAIRAELIQQSNDVSPEFQGMAAKIKETTVWINRIIGEMLETAGLEAGKITLKRKKLDLSALAGRVISTNQALADNKNQLLQLETDGPLLLSVDENKMFEITDNLINNAIKYSPRNKNITIRVQRKNNVATLEVQDEGPGFTDHDKTHLFQRFSRLSAQPTAGEHSTGLGLSIVKTLVEAHGGQVWVDSNGQDKGALVKVELPILGSE